MIIRPFTNADINEIDKIWKEGYANDFSLPDLTNAATFAVIEDEGVIIGFGIVKIFAEAIMILDKSKSVRDKVEIIKLLLNKAETDCKTHNIKQLHVFCKDERFADILSKHFNFSKIQTVALQKEL